MTKEFITLSFQQWKEQFKPDSQRFGYHTSSPEPYLYETYGEDYGYVGEHYYRLVWTLCEEDGESFIVNGARFVNRLGYYCCLNAWDDNFDYQVDLDSEEFAIVSSFGNHRLEVVKQIADSLNLEYSRDYYCNMEAQAPDGFDLYALPQYVEPLQKLCKEQNI